MKATGMTRPLDALGRIVIPKELRMVLDLNEGDRMEIYLEGDSVVMRKYVPCCLFCGDEEDLISFGGKQICRDCAAAIGSKAE